MPNKDNKFLDQDSPGHRLAMLHRLNMAYMSGPMSKLNIRRGQLGFLMDVFHHEGIIQEDLTRNLCIDRAATARALFQLEQNGLVRREEDAKDRRRKRVYSTDQARTLMPSLVKALNAHNEVLFAGLNKEERKAYLTMLDRLVDNMRAALETSAS